ncbi:MAG: hypothetical protein ACD_20C00137G0006 [uncultured bacterium]|nr:MAG: hypothetical protein ACD_20C00137G0006 [uncultured bacterium]
MSEENNPKSFTRTLNLFDATSIVAGAMIGSGIFIVSSQIARDVQSASLLLLVWLLAGIMTLIGALCYGEYAASWPDAGGQYVYIKKIWGEITGFVYGWSLFLVIQTGTIAAVAIAFAKFLGILLPIVSSSYKLASFYGLSISTQQLVAIFILVALTAVNARGVKDASFTQNIFTVAKVLALLGIVFCGIFFGLKPEVISANFSNALSAPDINISVFSAVAIAMVGAIFAADAWNNVTFIAGEIKKPERNLPFSLFLGSGIVITLYLLTNLIYLFVLPMANIQTATEDIVGATLMQAIFGNPGQAIIAVVILISAFGCLNGMILAGARVYYAMAKDGLFFKKLAILGKKSQVPENSLYLQCFWASVLVMSGSYSAILDYVICTTLIFYILTIGGIFLARKKYPDIPRPYKAVGYPYFPIIYCILAVYVVANLLIYRPETTWPGFILAATGIPVYLFWKRKNTAKDLELQDIKDLS